MHIRYAMTFQRGRALPIESYWCDTILPEGYGMTMVLEDDRMKSITASDSSSRECVMTLPGVDDLLSREYREVFHLTGIDIFQRIGTRR